MRGKSMKNMSFILAACLLMFAGAGCVNIQFTETTKLPPLSEDARIAVFYNPAKLPVPIKEMQKAGSVEVSSFDTGNTGNDLRNKIISCAREHGANVVLFTSVEYIPDGEARADQIRNISAPGWDKVDNTSTNVRQEWNAFQNSNSSDPEIPTYTIRMKADLYLAPASLLKRKEVPLKRKPVFTAPEKSDFRINVK